MPPHAHHGLELSACSALTGGEADTQQVRALQACRPDPDSRHHGTWARGPCRMFETRATTGPVSATGASLCLTRPVLECHVLRGVAHAGSHRVPICSCLLSQEVGYSSPLLILRICRHHQAGVRVRRGLQPSTRPLSPHPAASPRQGPRPGKSRVCLGDGADQAWRGPGQEGGGGA